MADLLEKKWWAWQGLNLRPLRCQGRVPRSFYRKTADFRVPLTRTAAERLRNLARVYRSFTAYPAQGIEAGTAETVQQGSVHESPVGTADAPQASHPTNNGGNHANPSR